MLLRISLFLVQLIFISLPVLSQTDPSDSDTLEATYPGGTTAWRKFLESNLKAEVATENGAPAGYYTVMVRFVVAKDGSTSDVTALTKFGYGMEQEVIRIIKKTGNWIPASLDGNPVNSCHHQPVTFVIINDGLDITTNVPNKLFAGIDNPISISASRIKAEDLTATATNGRITPLGNGTFNVKPIDTTRRTVITVYNAKKKDKEIGSESFEVRPGREAPNAKKD